MRPRSVDEYPSYHLTLHSASPVRSVALDTKGLDFCWPADLADDGFPSSGIGSGVGGHGYSANKKCTEIEPFLNWGGYSISYVIYFMVARG